jgi:hypothetical protein
VAKRGGESTALTQNKAPLYDPLTLTFDAATEDVLVEGLTVRAVKSASEAMQLFARACLAVTAGSGNLCGTRYSCIPT